MPNSFSLPLFSTIEFIAFILLIYLLLRIIIKIISFAKVFRKVYIFTKRILPIFDLAILVTIFFWFIFRFWGGSDIFPIITTAITLILLILFGWFWGRDFIAGVILKSEGYFEKNKKIRLNNKSGRIIRTTFRYLEFETDDGETLRVPYSRISGEYFSKLSPGEKYESHTIIFEVKEATDTKTLRETVRKHLQFAMVSCRKGTGNRSRSIR
ncbi:mechanosensitive ion channel domain-containing protein [Bacteroidota bacterium]